METIIGSCISAAVTLLVCMINANKTRALLEYRLDELTKKVEKHNSIVERTYKIEESLVLHEEKLKVANHRLDDLERKE